MQTTLFELGQVVATPGALAAIREAGQTPGHFLRRHASGDWGDIDGHDHKANQIAMREGGRLVSAYQTRKGENIWVITEQDRSSTGILLPSEY